MTTGRCCARTVSPVSLLQVGEMHAHDGPHRLEIGEADVMEEAAAQEGIRQLLLVVRGDDDHRAMLRPHGLAGLVDVELHPVEFLQQIVGKLDVGLVDLVDEQDDPARRLERLPQLALADVVAHVVHTLFAQLAVAQTADGIIFVKALLRLCGALHMPFDERQAQRLRHLTRELRLSGARLSLDQKRPLERHGRIHRHRQVLGGDIGRGGGKFHLRCVRLGEIAEAE